MSQPVYSHQYRHSWALLVGIDQYRDPRLPPLATAVKGARAVAQLLQDDLGFDPERIIHLENEKATLRAIRRAFTDPLCRADLVGPDDRVLVYFGGHGLTYDTAEGEFGCIAPYDIEAQYFDTAIPMDELTRAANRMHAKHVLFLLDACFSGYATVREVDPGVQRQAEDFLTRPVRQVITAGTRDQAVSDLWGPEQHALFTGFLLEGLRGAAPAPGGVLRAFHLAGYLQDAVAQHSRSRQTPQYASLMGSRGGDFIFSVRDVVKLPDWIVAAVESDDAGQRMVAASRLLDIVQGDDPRLADAALAHLERLAGDENPLVRSSAAAALEQAAPPPAPPPPEVVRHELPVVEPMPEAQPPPRVSEPVPTPVAEPAPAAEPPARERAAPRRGLPGWVWAVGVLGVGLAAAALLAGGLALAGVFAPKAAPEPTREEEAAPAEEAAPEEAISSEEEPKLEIFHMWGSPGGKETVDAMFAALAERYPEIEVVENPGAGDSASVWDTLQTRLAASDPPDTFQVGSSELKAYVGDGTLEPLDDLWDELGYYNVVPRPLADVVSVDGHPYAVPLNMHIQNVLYYNQVWFDEQGLEPPKNFDELIFACQVFYEAGYTDYPMGLGTLGNWEASFVLDSILLELGGPEYYVSLYKGEIDVTTDATYREALERLAALYQYTNPDHPALWWDESLDRVVSGDSAMVIMGTWAIGALTSWGWTLGEDFDAVIFPQEPERILLFHPETYGLAVGAPHPDSTMKWLEVVASPDLQIPTDVTQGGLFARTDIDPTEFPDPFRQETQQFVRDNPESLILGQFGSIAPLDFSGEYWVIIADFMAESDPDINATIAAVASVFEAHAVRNQAAWYTWP